MPTTSQTVPIIDFAPFLHGTEAEKALVAAALDSAFREVGFVYLQNHSVDKGRVERCFQWSSKFFSLPSSIKQLAPHPPGGSHHRGYSGIGVEKVSQHVFSKEDIAALREVPDCKESFESGNVTDELQPNIWLPEEKMPGFRE